MKDLNDVKLSITNNHDTPLLIRLAIIETVSERGCPTFRSVAYTDQRLYALGSMCFCDRTDWLSLSVAFELVAGGVPITDVRDICCHMRILPLFVRSILYGFKYDRRFEG